MKLYLSLSDVDTLSNAIGARINEFDKRIESVIKCNASKYVVV